MHLYTQKFSLRMYVYRSKTCRFRILTKVHFTEKYTYNIVRLLLLLLHLLLVSSSSPVFQVHISRHSRYAPRSRRCKFATCRCISPTQPSVVSSLLSHCAVSGEKQGGRKTREKERPGIRAKKNKRERESSSRLFNGDVFRYHVIYILSMTKMHCCVSPDGLCATKQSHHSLPTPSPHHVFSHLFIYLSPSLHPSSSSFSSICNINPQQQQKQQHDRRVSLSLDSRDPYN